MFISLSAAWQFKFIQWLMPSVTADASKEHLDFDSSVMVLIFDRLCAITNWVHINLLICPAILIPAELFF